jgi:hypothetical protein
LAYIQSVAVRQHDRARDPLPRPPSSGRRKRWRDVGRDDGGPVRRREERERRVGDGRDRRVRGLERQAARRSDDGVRGWRGREKGELAAGRERSRAGSVACGRRRTPSAPAHRVRRNAVPPPRHRARLAKPSTQPSAAIARGGGRWFGRRGGWRLVRCDGGAAMPPARRGGRGCGAARDRALAGDRAGTDRRPARAPPPPPSARLAFDSCMQSGLRGAAPAAPATSRACRRHMRPPTASLVGPPRKGNAWSQLRSATTDAPAHRPTAAAGADGEKRLRRVGDGWGRFLGRQPPVRGVRSRSSATPGAAPR